MSQNNRSFNMGTSIFTHNQRGMALPLVLMLLMLLTVLGTGRIPGALSRRRHQGSLDRGVDQ